MTLRLGLCSWAYSWLCDLPTIDSWAGDLISLSLTSLCLLKKMIQYYSQLIGLG